MILYRSRLPQHGGVLFRHVSASRLPQSLHQLSVHCLVRLKLARSVYFSIPRTEIITENNEKARNPCRNFVQMIILSHHHGQWHVLHFLLKYGICRANGKAGTVEDAFG